MRTILVCGREIEVPEPMYIIPGTVEVSNLGEIISGKCIFPLTDTSIKDRIDHANHAHLLFVMWNCAAIVRNLRSWKRSLAEEVTGVAKRIIPPDTECEFRSSLSEHRVIENKVFGTGRTEFNIAGLYYSHVTVKFIAHK